MINGRIYGNTALKLTDENYIIETKSNRKYKWRLKEGYKNFYIGFAEFLGLLGTIAAMPYAIALIFR